MGACRGSNDCLSIAVETGKEPVSTIEKDLAAGMTGSNGRRVIPSEVGAAAVAATSDLTIDDGTRRNSGRPEIVDETLKAILSTNGYCVTAGMAGNNN